jgi:hypothetical protein
MAMLKGGTSSAGTTFSDLPFHLSLISSFAYGANSGTGEFQTPFYLNENLCYPIIPDFHSAILVGCGGASLRISVAIPSMFLLYAVTFALHSLAIQFSSLRFVPELTIICWLLASGVGWKYAFSKNIRADPNANLVHAFGSNGYTFWIHSLIHYLLPQRSGMFSTPFNIQIVSLLFDAVEGGFLNLQALLLAGLLMGLLPMLSAHSYLGVGEYAIFLCLSAFPFRNRKQWKQQVIAWGTFGVTAVILSLPQILWLMRQKRENFMQFNPIYKETDARMVLGFFKVWWYSLGSILVIAIGLVWSVMEKRQIEFYRPSIGVWIVSNLIRYQPGAMDNTKVFFAGWYSLACAAVAHYAVVMWQRKKFIVRISIVLALAGGFASGCICIWKAAFWPFPMFSKDERDIGVWVMHNTKRDAAVLAGGWHANTLMSLAGKLVTMGYGGWVWTHGLSLDARNKFMGELVRDRENVSKFTPQKIEYAIWKSDDHDRGFSFPPVGPESRWLLVFDIGHLRVYRILKR